MFQLISSIHLQVVNQKVFIYEGGANKFLARPGRKQKKVKDPFMGLFQHCGRSAYCILTPNKFPHSSPEAPRIIQMRESSTTKTGTITNEFC